MGSKGVGWTSWGKNGVQMGTVDAWILKRNRVLTADTQSGCILSHYICIHNMSAFSMRGRDSVKKLAACPLRYLWAKPSLVGSYFSICPYTPFH